MLKIHKNCVVSFSFVLKDEENNSLDESGQQPAVYLHGYREIMPLLEQALENRVVGEKLIVKIPADKAYGKWDPHLVRKIPLSRFSHSEKLKEGMEVYPPDNPKFRMKIMQIEVENVMVDVNHPLAGKDLIFEVEILNIREASSEEIAQKQ